MTTRALVHTAAWWDADAGPPEAALLPRAERLAASFSTRILAHVLGRVAARSPVPLPDVPWVLGSPDDAPHEPAPELRRALGPSRGLALVHAGPATVAMALVEALGVLVAHEVVLLAFVQDATPPHHEALAVALLLMRSPAFARQERPGSEGLPERALALVLEAPTLRRTSSHSVRPDGAHPLMAARALARAVLVGRPTVETVPSVGTERAEQWRIELARAE
jgi:hypothetical protein